MASTSTFPLTPPIVIIHHVAEAVRRWQWQRVVNKFPALTAPHGSPQPHVDVEPIRRLLARDRPAEAWLGHHRAALSSAVCGGQWPQVRLHAAGLVDHPHCMLCFRAAALAQDSGAHVDWDTVPQGTIAHRIAVCPHLEGPRAASAPTALVERMAHALIHDPSHLHIIWTRALVPRPPLSIPPPSQVDTFRWTMPLSERSGPRTFYTDASGIDIIDRRLGRIGWAFVVVDRDSQSIVGAAAGLPPPWINSVAGGEGWALFQASQYAEPPDTFVVDCLGTIQALARGRMRSLAAHSRLARVNAMLFTHFDDPEDVKRVTWMPSHRPEHEVGVTEKTMAPNSHISIARLTAWLISWPRTRPPCTVYLVTSGRASPGMRRRWRLLPWL